MSFMLGHSGTYHFHSDSNQFWNPSHAHDNVEFGRLAVNGQIVIGTTTNVPTEMSIISLPNGVGDVEANTFSRDRTVAGRNWNGDLAELLIYNTPLTDGEIRDIETRLAIKWGFPYSPQSQVVDTFDNTVLGEWTITYTATDSANVSRSAMRTVEVHNPDAPVITLVGGRTSILSKAWISWIPAFPWRTKMAMPSTLPPPSSKARWTATPLASTSSPTTLPMATVSMRHRWCTVTVSDTLGPVITLAGGTRSSIRSASLSLTQGILQSTKRMEIAHS